jgi:hypothetical protein
VVEELSNKDKKARIIHGMTKDLDDVISRAQRDLYLIMKQIEPGFSQEKALWQLIESLTADSGGLIPSMAKNMEKAVKKNGFNPLEFDYMKQKAQEVIDTIKDKMSTLSSRNEFARSYLQTSDEKDDQNILKEMQELQETNLQAYFIIQESIKAVEKTNSIKIPSALRKIILREATPLLSSAILNSEESIDTLPIVQNANKNIEKIIKPYIQETYSIIEDAIKKLEQKNRTPVSAGMREKIRQHLEPVFLSKKLNDLKENKVTYTNHLSDELIKNQTWASTLGMRKDFGISSKNLEKISQNLFAIKRKPPALPPKPPALLEIQAKTATKLLQAWRKKKQEPPPKKKPNSFTFK